jgi:hypothetical protein
MCQQGILKALLYAEPFMAYELENLITDCRAALLPGRTREAPGN